MLILHWSCVIIGHKAFIIIYLIMRIKCILLVTLFSLAFSFNMFSENKVKVLENYQMSNYTGAALTSDMVIAYIKHINNAYSYFGSDLRLNT